ncbi:MAG: hypothetical protein Kow0069_21420 [Promethearchaeota archaeon]
MTADMPLEDYIEYLETVIRGRYSPPSPFITVIHFRVSEIREVYTQFVVAFRALQTKYADWRYRLLNLEQVFFAVLREKGYFGEEDLLAETKREEFQRDVGNNGLRRVVDKIKEALNDLSAKNSSSKTPVLLLLNIHACYPFIRTGDITSRVMDQQQCLLLILYADDDVASSTSRDVDKVEYKLSNYNVNTVWVSTQHS